MKRNGSLFFTATSMLMLTGGAVGIVNGVSAVLGAGALAAEIGNAANFGRLMLGAILLWGSGLAGLVAGINGRRREAKAEKTMLYLLFCLLAATLTVLGNLFAVSGGGSLHAPSLLAGLALPTVCLLCECLREHSV